jgi:hypothetical protein
MHLMLRLPLVIFAVVCIGTTLFYPTRCMVEGDLLKVRSLARTLTFDLRQATSCSSLLRMCAGSSSLTPEPQRGPSS